MNFEEFLNPNSINTQHVHKLEEVLTEILAKECGTSCAYVNVDEIELSYLTCEDPTDKPLITIHIRYGVVSTEKDWQKETDLTYSKSSLDFIAGQFYQVVTGEI